MLKVIRLSTELYRRWRLNEMFLVDADENPVRPANQAEVNAYNQHQLAGVDLELELEGGKHVKFRTSRTLLKRALLAEHGDVQLRSPNSMIICTVRDPAHKRMSPEESARSAPSPAYCECAQWGEPHPGRHHAVCQYNKYAPANERGDVRAASFIPGQPVVLKATELAAVDDPLPQVAPAHTPSARTMAQPPAPPVSNIPDPAHCICSAWLSPDGTPATKRWGHHPICSYHDAWLALHPEPPAPSAATEVQEAPAAPAEENPSTPPEPAVAAPQYFLYTLDKEELRPALPDEVAEAEAAAKTSGSPLIILDDVHYLVATRDMMAGG